LHDFVSMKYLFILVYCVSTVTGFCQKETTPRVYNRDDSRTKAVALTKAQQEWLSTHFSELARLPKANAAALVRQNIPSLADATLEYLIGLAGKLAEHDARKSLDQLNQLQGELIEEKKKLQQAIKQGQQQQAKSAKQLMQQTRLQQLLDQLKAQKASLLALIAEKEAELAAMIDPISKELLKLVINSLKQTLTVVNNGIKEAQDSLRNLQNG
jgi:flagellar biosynthesis/type III secretory pathway protein FliH